MKKKNGYFFPTPQIWKVVKAEPKVVLSDDEKGIPKIYERSFVHISENYFTFMNFNNGLYYVIGSCFKRKRGTLEAIPYGKFKKFYREKAEFNLGSKNIKITLPNRIELTLEKAKIELFTEHKQDNYKRFVAYATDSSDMLSCIE